MMWIHVCTCSVHIFSLNIFIPCRLNVEPVDTGDRWYVPPMPDFSFSQGLFTILSAVHLNWSISSWRSSYVGNNLRLPMNQQSTLMDTVGDGWQRPGLHRKAADSSRDNWEQCVLFRAAPCSWPTKAVDVAQEPYLHLLGKKSGNGLINWR